MFDAHAHVYEYSLEELEKIKDIKVICVTEDLESLKKSLELAERFDNLIVFAGIHPWNYKLANEKYLKKFEEFIDKNIDKIFGIGEVGLDRIFVKEIEKQKKIFEFQVKIAKEYNLPLNVHSAGALKDVLKILQKFKIEKVNIHWFSNPNFVKQINELNYFASFNQTLEIKENHKKCLELINENLVLIESDGPYNYKNIYLHTLNIKNTCEIVKKLKEIDENKIANNFKEYLKSR